MIVLSENKSSLINTGYANFIKFVKITLTERAEKTKSAERQKTSFPKELAENASLCKPVLNKIMTLYE